MSVCRAGLNCNHVVLSEAVPLRVPGAVALQRTPDEIKAAVQAELQPLIVCWRLRDDIRNHRFLRNASGVLTGGGALGTSLWGATHSGDDRKKGLMVGGGATALGALGLAHQSYNINVAEKAFLANKCSELIAQRDAKSVVGSQSRFSDVVFQGDFGANFDSCPGADVLTRGCIPVRRIESSTVWSNEPLTPQQIAVGAGIVIIGAAAVYTGVAGVAALAEAVASWGWVPALAL